MTTDPRPGQPQRRSWALPSACLALLVTVVALLALWLPIDWELGMERALLAPDGFGANGGFAYVMRYEADVPNDRDGESTLRVFEDGVELSPHASHATIRSKGEGRYSHWGNSLYLSASDNSDPRSNGRAYEVAVLGNLETRAPTARSLVSTAYFSAILALGLSLFAGRGGKVLAGLRGSCVVALICASSSDGRIAPWLDWNATLETHAARYEYLAGDAEPIVRAPSAGTAKASDTLRTQRLLSLDAAPVFSATSPALTPREPVEVLLVPGPGVSVEDGVTTLRKGQALVAAGELDLLASDVASLVLRLRVLQGDQIRIAFQADGKGAQAPPIVLPVAPSPDWQTLQIDHPLERGVLLAGDLARGQRRLIGVELGPTSSSAPVRIEVESMLLSDPTVVYSWATHGTERMTFARTSRPAHWQSVSGSFQVPLGAGSGRRLKGAIGLLAGADADLAEVDVTLVGANGDRVPLHHARIEAGAAWHELSTDLDPSLPLAGARLELGCGALAEGAVLAWSNFRTIDVSRPPQRVMLVLIDTLRADALACYGNETTDTPTLDGLADDGVRFANCFAQAHWTRPSMPSIMTGRYTGATGVTTGGDHLGQGYETLAESFAAAGFHTLGLLTNSHAGPASGLDQGLDQLTLDSSTYDTGVFLKRHAQPTLESLAEEDLFVWLHLMEVHGPYGPRQPPEGWEPDEDGTPVEWKESFDPKWHESPTVEARAQLYHDDLERLDHSLGEFLDTWLPRWDEDGGDPAVLAVASDHGELLGEDGHWGHMEPVMGYEAVHVPLIIRAPGLIDDGLVWEPPVENLDIGATLLDLAGVSSSNSAAGRLDTGGSLMPFLDGRASGDDHALAISAVEPNGRNWGTLTAFGSHGAMVGKRGKLLGAVPLGGREVAELPEPDRLISITFGVESAFRRLWTEHLKSQHLVHDALTAGDVEQTSRIDTEALEQMRALGYLGR